MKRTFIYMTMAALALASCSKNETTEVPGGDSSNPNKITFNTSTGTTRATANSIDQVKAGFNVLGFKANGGGTAFIPGKDNEGTYKETSNVWGWDGASYNWPEDEAAYPMTFYAEYPKVDMSVNTNLNKAITMELEIANQTDLLVAKGETGNNKPVTGFTQLQFKHILSNLVFKVETKDQYTVYIQSIRVVNTAKSGRTFDYATMAHSTEPSPYTDLATTDGTYKEAEGFYYRKGSTPWSFTGTVGTVVGTVASDVADNIMMQMPQMVIPSYWVESNTTDGLGKFKEDAKAWKDANGSLEDWYTGTVGGNPAGMNGSEGWKGARIEVIYRIYDEANSKSIIGRQTSEVYKDADGITDVTADKDLFIRVGYPLDLSQIKDATLASVGWQMNKRYTYTIQLGTAKATNGILLDPDYKGSNGETSDTPKKPVENPKVDPGNPTTPGTINFTVGVDEWDNNNTDVDIK